MSCDCYVIGGPWIAEDPDCEAHGTLARAAEEAAESYRSLLSNHNGILDLESRIERAIAASEKGSAGDAIQDMLVILRGEDQ
jgi:hypothetical protein